MEPIKDSVSVASSCERRVIKRYSNRKLYDTKDSRYVTLQQIGAMVRAGEEVQIIDNATKEDKTEVTLALIISEDLKAQPRSVPLGTLRDLIQERGEKLLSQLREGPIGRLIPGTHPPEGEAEPSQVQENPTDQEPTPSASEKVHLSARINELVENSKQTIEEWHHTIDERIRASLPGMSLFRELDSEVRRLSERLSSIEGELEKLKGSAKEKSDQSS